MQKIRKETLKIYKNKFNYSQIEIQNPSRLIKQQGVSTLKPMLINFNGTVNQSMIYERYIEFSKQNYMEKLVEIGIEKKDTSKK